MVTGELLVPIYTPRGLKIRLDELSVAEVIDPLLRRHDLNDIFADVELWENLPKGLVGIGATSAAILTGSPWWTFGISLICYLVGSFARNLIYSDILRILVPLSFGSWVISTLVTLIVAGYLIIAGNYWTGAILFLINQAAHFGIFNIFDLLMTPLRVFVRKLLGLPPTHVETVFVTICNKRAKKYGLKLNWDSYGIR